MRHWLREYRISAGLSQKRVAQIAGITYQFYNYIENGMRRPSPEVAQRIASILGFEWTRFFENDNERDEHPAQ